MSRKIILYIAMSLDGFIADKNGGVSWLNGLGDTTEIEASYSEFIKGIDTVIMGRKTYEQIVNELSPDTWVYDGLKSYVVTSKYSEKNENVEFFNNNICEFVDSLKEQEGKDIWLVGGAMLVADFILANKIDEYHITVMPIILGNGIPLFPKGNELRLHLNSCNTFGEIVMLKYSSCAN